MTHPLQHLYDARKSLVQDKLNGYCHVGGIENFAKFGIFGDNTQYGHSHIVDHNLSDRSECIFCGREFVQEVVSYVKFFDGEKDNGQPKTV